MRGPSCVRVTCIRPGVIRTMILMVTNPALYGVDSTFSFAVFFDSLIIPPDELLISIAKTNVEAPYRVRACNSGLVCVPVVRVVRRLGRLWIAFPQQPKEPWIVDSKVGTLPPC